MKELPERIHDDTNGTHDIVRRTANRILRE